MGLDRELAEVAAEQRMLVTYADVIALGGTSKHVQRRIKSGRWVAVAPGVYLIAGAPMPWETEQLVAVLAAGPGAAASHRAAARLWGIRRFEAADVELSVPRGALRPRKDVRIHESTDLDRCTIVERDGVPVTDAARTLLDLARFVWGWPLQRSIEDMRRRELVTWSDLIKTLAVHARRGRHGVRRLRRVILADAHRAEITDTDMELLVLGLIREAGLPEPVVHYRIVEDGIVLAVIDLAYPGLRIAIECDGSVHLVEEVRDVDLPRQNWLILNGWTVLRFSYSRVRDHPESVVRDIRAAIEAAQRAAR